ncbi:DNA-3-methyladenine glycosylase family protein [Rhizosaccharibacter radicis]|uniref:DNA-3-methyladenine glycosylase II n=1 Tax=Rhizosaccharibacter radicis TaxID=2782605 RepID=A0ABT1VX01_9PROT|nr:DNA-3-methyladenine glycosylase 2 family protein [Acetobacteraceae bacterium KSS12]
MAGRRHLLAADPELAALIRRVGRCRLRADTTREPFESLIRAIAHQQLHGRAAEAILGRMLALDRGDGGGAFPDAAGLLAVAPEALRGCGFSMGKIAAMRAVCEARLAGVVPTRRQAARMPDEVLIERLTSLKGIGRWTVEMLLIFSLGRPDVMPVDDFAVREGWRLIKKLDRQPKPKQLLADTRALSPYRSMAAWYLWRAADEAKPPGIANPMTGA